MPVINPDFDPDGQQFKTSSRLDYQGNVILRDVSKGKRKRSDLASVAIDLYLQQ